MKQAGIICLAAAAILAMSCNREAGDTGTTTGTTLTDPGIEITDEDTIRPATTTGGTANDTVQ